MVLGRLYPLLFSIPPTPQNDSGIIDDTKLTAHWKLSDVNDAWYNTLTLTNNGGATFRKGKFGNCVKLDGTNDYLSRASTNILNIALVDASWFVCIRGLKQSGTRTIFQKYSAGAKGYKLEVNGATGILTFSLGVDSVKTVVSTTDVLDGKWHKVIIVVQRSSSLKIHVDSRGPQNTTDISTTTGSGDNTTAFHIGASATPDQYFTGEIDELRFYKSKVFTNADIDTLMDLSERYVVGTEERGAKLELYTQDQSILNVEFSGKDARWRRRYVDGSQMAMLYDNISMANLQLLLNFEKTLDDESTNALTISAINSPTFIDGFYSATYALHFVSASSQRLEIDDIENLNFGTSRDISLRFKFKTSSNTMYLFMKGREGSNSRIFVKIDAAGKLAAEISDGTNTKTATSSGAVNNGSWHTGVVVFDRNGSLTIDVDGVNVATTAGLSAVGDINNTEKFLIGAGLDSSGTVVSYYNGDLDGVFLYDRELVAQEKTDAHALTSPTLACIYDGIIMETPTLRKTSLPFTAVCKDYLFDRLANDDLTVQFAGTTKLGFMMRTAILKSSLSADFTTDDVEDTDKVSNGKYFIRTPLIDVFRWITDTAHTTFYSKRRGNNRYLFHHLVTAKHSGVTINPNNLLTTTGYGLYNGILQQSNIIEVEGGVLKTIEEQQTFDNGTTKASNGTYYAIKATPEFIKYGQVNIKVKSGGSPTADLQIEIREDKAGSPAGPTALTLASVFIPKENIIGKGLGFTNGELVSLTAQDGSGSGAQGTAIVDADGGLTGVTITTGGSGYTNGEAVDVVALDGGGSGATGTVTVAAGAVTAFTQASILSLKPVDFDIELKTGSTYWIVIFPEGDGTDRFLFADNGGVADTNMKTSSDDVTWSAVGYTLVYDFRRKDPVLTTVKDSSLSQTYQPRKLRFFDSTITDKATARSIGRGLLEKLGKVHVDVENLYVKNLSLIPLPGQAITVVDNVGTSPAINGDFELYEAEIELPKGHGGYIDHMLISIGDKRYDANTLFKQLVADTRRTIEGQQQVITDPRTWGESQKVGIRIVARLVEPVGGEQRIGIQTTLRVVAFLANSNMKWDDTTDPDNVYDYAVWDPT